MSVSRWWWVRGGAKNLKVLAQVTFSRSVYPTETFIRLNPIDQKVFISLNNEPVIVEGLSQ